MAWFPPRFLGRNYTSKGVDLETGIQRVNRSQDVVALIIIHDWSFRKMRCSGSLRGLISKRSKYIRSEYRTNDGELFQALFLEDYSASDAEICVVEMRLPVKVCRSKFFSKRVVVV